MKIRTLFLSALSQALSLLRSALANLRSAYGPSHPVVRSLAMAEAKVARGEPFPRSPEARNTKETETAPVAKRQKNVVIES